MRDSLTRRAFLHRALVTGIGLLTAACGAAVTTPVVGPSSGTGTPVPSSMPPSPIPTPSPVRTPSPTPVAPLRARIARLLLVGFRGATADEASATLADIRDRGLGGVLLFDVDQPTGGVRNVVSPRQVATLTAALQDVAGGDLIVAIDEEGGSVARLDERHGFPATISATDLGARDDPGFTRGYARSLAQVLRDAGITLNLAPVVDLDLNPANPVIGAIGRSFGADPERVVAQAQAFVGGHHDIGVHTAIKHFPGQGSASGDTHAGFVDVTGTWTRVELEPFARLITTGTADAVMTAHIFDAGLDAELPATLSKSTVTVILRRELGFAGPVISDDLQMGAIRDRYGYADAVRLALGAGVDLLLVANQQLYVDDLVRRTIDIVETLVADGVVPEDLIDAAVARVATLRGPSTTRR